jgi:hypothetical protein
MTVCVDEEWQIEREIASLPKLKDGIVRSCNPSGVGLLK